MHLLTRCFPGSNHWVTENKAFGLHSLMAVNSQRAKLACKWNITHIVWGVKFGTDVFIPILGLSMGWWGFPWLLNNGASSQQEHVQLLTLWEHFFDIYYALHSRQLWNYTAHTHPFHAMIKLLVFCNYSTFNFPSLMVCFFSLSYSVLYYLLQPNKKVHENTLDQRWRPGQFWPGSC